MEQDQNFEYMEINRKRWDEMVSVHEKSKLYRMQDFLAGGNKLNDLERSEVGDVEGKNLLHLQCHFGMDTLSWARLGAHVTGIDFSEKAIEKATELAQTCNLDARFLCCNLYDLPQHLMGQFDIVYTSYGVLCWLPDIPRWAKIVASYVKPGGSFYIAEFHPFAMVFDDESDSLKYRYPYFDKSAMRFDLNGTYADPDAKLQNTVEYGWNYSMSEVVSSLINEGLRIEFLHEFPYSVFYQLPMLEEDENGLWWFPNKAQPIPLIFSIKATKENNS